MHLGIFSRVSNIGNCVAYANGNHEEHVLNSSQMQIS